MNQALRSDQLQSVCQLTDDDRQRFTGVVGQMKLSARGVFRVLRVARTIADLSGSDGVVWPHLSQALAFRGKILA